ncbi:MAG: phage tail protein [Nitrosomonas sp.]|nr:phage tail protein [Nitrosomonas sp.]
MISASLHPSADYVLLETTDFKAQINPLNFIGGQYISNFFGCSTYVFESGKWFVALNGSYAFLKIAHRDFNYEGGLWPHASNSAANAGTWSNRQYGTRTVGGVNEAYCSATWKCNHPISTQAKSLGYKVILRTEWIVREGESRVYRNDTLTVDQKIYDVQLNHFAGIDKSTAALQGLVKTYVDDCETLKTWVFDPASASNTKITAERQVGTACTQITVDADVTNPGKECYQTFAGQDWSDYHHYTYWIKPVGSTDKENAIRWYIVDSVGGKQYLGQPVSLTKDYILNDDKTAHDYIGRWRQVNVDMTGMTRSNVIEWGFECLVDDYLSFYIDDVFGYAWQEYDQTTTLENIIYPTITYPFTFKDQAAFPDAPLKADFTKLSHLPFAINYSTHDVITALCIVSGDLPSNAFTSPRVRQFEGYWNGDAITWKPGTSNDGKATTVTNQLNVGLSSQIFTNAPNKIWQEDAGVIEKTLASGTLASAMMVKSKYSVQWARLRVLDPDTGEESVVAGTRAVGRVRNTELTTYTFEAVYCSEWAASRAAGRTSLLSFYNSWDVPEFASRTSADLPQVSKIQKLLQSNPKDRYLMYEYTRDLFERMKSVKCGYVAPAATPGIVMYRYNDAWLKNTPWDTTMTDNRVDYMQFWCDTVKGELGLPVVAESTAAVPEGYLEIPHYNTAHIATLEDGSLFRIFFWVYADEDDFFIIRDRVYGDVSVSSYYDPIVEDGRTYHLSYTYPLSGTCLASAYGTEAEFGQPTIADFRLNQLQHIVDNYDVDCITLSEDCTFYHHGSYGAADLASYNYWRTNIRSPLASAVTEFPRQIPGSPLSPSNLVLVDTMDLWDWKAWLAKRFVTAARDICHGRGVQLMVDINLESTLRTYDHTSAVYDQAPSLHIQDAAGNWFVRDFQHYGRRYSTDMRDMLDVADLLYIWCYGNFNPWGFAQNFNDFVDFIKNKGFEGRMLMGPGLYPDPNPPTPQEIEYALTVCGQLGFSAVIPASKQWGSYSTDYLWYIDRGLQTICDFDLTGSVLTCDHTRGIYFPKAVAGTITLSIPGGSTVKKYNKGRALLATYAPYAGAAISIAAGDSLLIDTGTTPDKTIKPYPYQSPYTKGIGMLSDVLTALCTASGRLTASDIDTSELALVNVYGFVIDGGSPDQAIETLRDTFLFDVIEQGGKIVFKKRPRSVSVTVPYADLIPVSTSSVIDITHENDFDLPREVVVEYNDAAHNYEPNSQRSTIQNTLATDVLSKKLPISIDSDYARQVAEIIHKEKWANRDKFKFSLPLSYLSILPGDSVNLTFEDGAQRTVRILNRTIGDYIEYDAVADIYDMSSSATGGTGGVLPGNTIKARVSCSIVMFPSAPLLDASLKDTPGLFYSILGNADPDRYPGAGIYTSTDNVTFSLADTTAINSTYGTTTTALGDTANPGQIDRINTVKVSLTYGTLESVTFDDLLAGKNLAMIGSEVIQYQNATFSAGVWTLSNLIRGLSGTEYTTWDHAIGDKFLRLTATDVDFMPLSLSLMNSGIWAKSVTSGMVEATEPSFPITPAANHLLPLAPCNVRKTVRVNHDIIITWDRRARVNSGWNNNSDVPLDFATESYQVDIYDTDNTTVAMSYIVSTPTVNYTSSDQQDWYGAGVYAPNPLKIRVRQISDIFGLGIAKTVTI